jgi:hypothetical protein
MSKAGTVFVQIGLDAGEFTKGQKDILNQSKATALESEKNFRTLGTQSDRIFNTMKQNAESAYGAINASSKTSAAERLRAHEALGRQIADIDKKMAGGTTASIKAMETSSLGSFTKITSAIGLGNIAAQAFQATLTGVVSVFKAGFKAAEDFQMSVAAIASSIATFSEQGKTDMAGAYKEAYKYASALVPKLEEWDAKTVATGKQLSAMVETMIQAGVLVDINNKKHEQGIIAIANALALTTKGQNADIQFRQETRALMDGEIKSTNRLATMINNVMGGALQENIKLWKEEGTVIENIGALLKGFSEGAADFENTWAAVGSTIETITNKLLRDTFLPVYEDIIRLAKEYTVEVVKGGESVTSVKDTLQTGVHKAWEAIKGAASAVYDVIRTFEEPIKIWLWYTSQVLDKLGMVLVILPLITERVWHIAEAWKNAIMMIGNFASALYYVVTGQFDKAQQAVIDGKSRWTTAGAHVGEAFDTGLGAQITSALAKYKEKIKNFGGSVTAPKLMTPEQDDKKADKAADKAAKAAEREIETARKASDELDVLTGKTSSKLEEHLAQIQKKYNDLAPKLKGNVEALVRLEEWRTTAIAAEYAKQDEQTEKYFVDAVKNYDAGVKEMQQVIDDAQKTLDKKIETRGHLAIAIDPRSPAALQALKDEFNKKLDAQEIFAEDFELRERYRAKSIADIDRGWLIEQLKDQLTYYSGVEGYAEKTYELKKQLIELEARQAISKGSDPNAVAVKTAQELHDAYITAAESGDDFFAGVNAGLLEITKSHVTWGKAASDITKQVFSEMEGALSKSLYAIVMKDWEKSKGMENINKEREALDKKYEEDVARIKAEAAVRSEDDKAKVSDAEYVKKKIEELDKQMVDSKADLVKKEKELDKSWMDNFKLIWEDAWKSILQTVIEYVAKIVVEWAILKTLGFIFNVKLDGNGNIIPIGDSGSGASAGDSSSNAMAQVGSFAASTAMSKMVGYGWDKMMGGLAETGAGKEVIAYWESLKESLGFAPTAQATPAASTTVPAGTTSGMDIVNTMQGAVPASQYTTANVELTQAGLQALEAQSAGSTYLTEAGLSALEAQSALTASNSVYLTEAGLSALETQSGIIAANAAGMGAGTAGAGAAGMTTASVGGVGSGGMGGGMVGAGGGGAGATGAAAAAGWGGIIIGAILIAKMVQDSMLDNDKQALAMIVAAQNNMMALTGAGAFGVKTDRNERFLDVGWGGSGNKLEGLIAELNANLSSQNKIIERELPGTATSQAAIKERDAIQKQIDAQKAKLPPGFVGTEARQGLTWSGSGGGMVDDLGREQNKQKYISNTATDKEKAAFLANEREYMRSKFKDAKINSRAMTEEEKNYFLNEGLKGQTDAVIAEMKRIEEAKTEFAKKAQDAIKAGAMMTMGGIDSVTGEVTKATLEMNKGTEEQLAIFEKYQVSMDAYNQAIADGATEAEAYIAAQKASAAAVAGAAEGIVTMGESAYDAAGDLLYVQSSADAASVSSSAAAGSVQSLANTFGLSAAQAASLTATLADTDDGTRTIEETIALLAETLGLSAEKAGELARALEEIPSDVNTNINVTTTETTIPGEVVVPSMPAGSASGGWITGGSGMRDDVFLGMTPGVAHWGMGGEFIVNKEAARRNGGLLEYINNKRYAEGGMIPNRAIFGANPEPGMIPNPAISTIRNIYPSGWNPEGKTDTEKKQRELEIELLETDPTKHIEALIKQRRDEMELLDASLRPMQQMIWSGELQNENDAKSLELMKLEGKTKEALNLERERELQDMDPTTQAIQKQIWAQEIVNQKKDMEIQLLILSGEPMKALTIARNKELAALDQTLVPFQQQIWLWELNNQKQTMNLELMKLSGQSIEALALERNKELQALDPSLHAVQRQIWAQELTNQKRQLEIDLMNAQGKTVEALAATREDELKTIDPSLRGLKQMIWAEEDLAKKRSEIVAENYRTSVDFKRAFYTGNVGNIKGYDSGGYHPGGLRIVGESGPELEWTGPSNIFNPKKMGITASTNDLVTEVRGMREELHALGVQTVMNTGKSARVMSRWDSDGQPDIRYNNTATWGN